MNYLNLIWPLFSGISATCLPNAANTEKKLQSQSSTASMIRRPGLVVTSASSVPTWKDIRGVRQTPSCPAMKPARTAIVRQIPFWLHYPTGKRARGGISARSALTSWDSAMDETPQGNVVYKSLDFRIQTQRNRNFFRDVFHNVNGTILGFCIYASKVLYCIV